MNRKGGLDRIERRCRRHRVNEIGKLQLGRWDATTVDRTDRGIVYIGKT